MRIYISQLKRGFILDIAVTVWTFGFRARWRPTVHTVLDFAFVAHRSAIGVFFALKTLCVNHILECGKPELKQMLFLAQVILSEPECSFDTLRSRFTL